MLRDGVARPVSRGFGRGRRRPPSYAARRFLVMPLSVGRRAAGSARRRGDRARRVVGPARLGTRLAPAPKTGHHALMRKNRLAGSRVSRVRAKTPRRPRRGIACRNYCMLRPDFCSLSSTNTSRSVSSMAAFCSLTSRMA